MKMLALAWDAAAVASSDVCERSIHLLHFDGIRVCCCILCCDWFVLGLAAALAALLTAVQTVVLQ
jgi:hypothetical protein